jgi:exonuclease VII large subunit
MMPVNMAEEHDLEVGCRFVSGVLRDGYGSSSMVPRLKNAELMTALECAEEVQRYDEELKRFQEAMARVTREYKIAARNEETTSKAENLKRAYEGDMDLIRRGLLVLQKRRGIFAGKVRSAKLQGLIARKTFKDAEKIKSEAQAKVNEIQDLKAALDAAVEKFNQLRLQFDNVSKKFHSLNLDREKAGSLVFNVELPENIRKIARFM